MLARFECISGGPRGAFWEFRSPMISVGRAHDNDLQLDYEEKGVSRHHCHFEERDGGWFLHDIGSTNGTLLNGKAVHGCCEVTSGDTIKFGRRSGPSFVMTFGADLPASPSSAREGVEPRRRRETAGRVPIQTEVVPVTRVTGKGMALASGALVLIVALVVIASRLLEDGGEKSAPPIPDRKEPALELPPIPAELDLEDGAETPLSELPPIKDWILGAWSLARQEGARVLGPTAGAERLRVAIARDDDDPTLYLARASEIGPDQRRLGDLTGREGQVILRLRFLSEASERGGTAYFRVARLVPGRDGSADRFVARNDYAWVDLRRGQLLGNVGAWLKEDER